MHFGVAILAFRDGSIMQANSNKKETISSINDDFGRLSSSPENMCFSGSLFGKLILVGCAQTAAVGDPMEVVGLLFSVLLSLSGC